MLFASFALQVCPICLDTMANPQALKCKHVFCSGCLQTALAVNNTCPVCKEPQVALRGNQPLGEMTSHCKQYRSVPGYEGNFKVFDISNNRQLEIAVGQCLSRGNKDVQCTEEAIRKICKSAKICGKKCRNMTLSKAIASLLAELNKYF